MAKGNMFSTVFDKPELEEEDMAEKVLQSEESQIAEKSDGLFCLKDLPESDRKPTTIIFSKRNYIRLKQLAVNENLNMSEVVNRWLEGVDLES